MVDQQKRRVLLCVAGMTPQIITETLYALHQKGEAVDEIVVITTLKGKDILVETLIKGGKLDEFCQEFGIDRNSIKFSEKNIILLQKPDDHTYLEDIRTEEENEIAGNQICEIVRDYCRDENTVIHASIAGGRKTMGVYLAYAMSLFGRAGDKISHVLVSSDFETHPEFFYKPRKAVMLDLRDGRKVSTDEAEVSLAEIPFVRLRGARLELFDDEQTTYKSVVERTQKDLEFIESVSELQLILKDRRLKVSAREVKLTPQEFFVYYMFAKFREKSEGRNGFVSLDTIDSTKLDDFCRELSRAWEGIERGFKDFGLLKRGEFVQNLEVSGETRKDAQQRYREVFSKINKKLEERGIPEVYRICSEKFNGETIYGIRLNGKKIKFKS
ncbi:MAG: CRISPR-associated ring nuclease Csm6 [Acidobacteriota bacterium]|nr:CRISPR-associated ring nuclease Csm6 [Acidobacteriota bacterium]